MIALYGGFKRGAAFAVEGACPPRCSARVYLMGAATGVPVYIAHTLLMTLANPRFLRPRGLLLAAACSS